MLSISSRMSSSLSFYPTTPEVLRKFVCLLPSKLKNITVKYHILFQYSKKVTLLNRSIICPLALYLARSYFLKNVFLII